MVDRGIADFLMPDVGKAEGITGVKQVIELAALKHQFYNPHSWSTAINTAASLHLCASATQRHLLRAETESESYAARAGRTHPSIRRTATLRYLMGRGLELR